MTISYSLEAATSRTFRTHKLMLKWKGSVWQCVWRNLLLWLICYSIISVIYRYLLPLWPKSVTMFENTSVFCQRYSEYIPITFLLGFYVNFVIQRWWDQYNCLGWADAPCLYIATYVRGTDETARIVRRSCARYLSLAQILLYRDISPVIRKRFPTTQHLIDANVMTIEESVSLDTLVTPYHKYFVPLQWTCTLLAKARDDGRIASDEGLSKVIKAVNAYRASLGTLFSYDWVSIPLVYTQVVTLGVKSYFVACLLGRQYLDPSKGYSQSEVDFYVPIFTILQFVFYMGWLSVAEVLMNPLGEDDDDFETNFVISRNLQMGLTIVDDNFGVIPTLRRDAFWNDATVELPHTEASHGKADGIPIGSCAELEVSPRGQKVVEATVPSAVPSEHNSVSETYGLPSFRQRKSTRYPAPCVPSQPPLSTHDPQCVNQTPSKAERQANEELFYNHLPRFAKLEGTPYMSLKKSRIAQDYLQRRQQRNSEQQANHKASNKVSVDSSGNGEALPSRNQLVTRPIVTEMAQEHGGMVTATGMVTAPGEKRQPDHTPRSDRTIRGVPLAPDVGVRSVTPETPDHQTTSALNKTQHTPRYDHSPKAVLSAADVGAKSVTSETSHKQTTLALNENDCTQSDVVTGEAALPIGASDHSVFSSPLSVIDETGESSRKESFDTTVDSAPLQPIAEVGSGTNSQSAAGEKLRLSDTWDDSHL